MTTEIKTRCLSILKENRLSIEKLFGRGTAEYGRATRQLQKEASLSVEVLLGVANAIPNVSLDWLLYGKGEKYKNTVLESSMSCTKEQLNNANELLDALRGQVESQRKVIELQEELIKNRTKS